MANRERLTREHKILRALRTLTREDEPAAGEKSGILKCDGGASAGPPEYASIDDSQVALTLLSRELPGVRRLLAACIHAGTASRARAK